MNNSILFFRRFLAILLFIYLTQINYNFLSKISVQIIEPIQSNTAFSMILKIISFIISYFILIFIIVFILTYIFIVNPNFVRKSTVLTFLCWTIGLFSFLKIFLQEFRPYLFAHLFTDSKIKSWDCETDFGMPSAHMILVVSIYYVYKVIFFCQEDHLKLTSQTQREENEQYSFRNHLNFPLVPLQYDLRGFHIEVKDKNNFNLRAFNLVSGMYIFLVGIFRIISGSHFPFQVLWGLLIGYFWSQMYFAYFSPKIQTFYFDIIVDSSSRKKSTRFFYIFQFVFVGYMFLYSLFIHFTINETTYLKAEAYIQEQCPHTFILEKKNVSDGLIVFLPLFYIFCLKNFNLGGKIGETGDKISQTFKDLSKRKKLRRIGIIILLLLLIFGNKFILDMIYENYAHLKLKSWFNFIILLIIYIEIAFLIAVLLPFIFFKLKILLENEYPTSIDFSDIQLQSIDEDGRQTYLIEDIDQDNNEQQLNDKQLIQKK